MRVLYSSNRNPHFLTFTEYIERGLKNNACEVHFFENRSFILPGRLRDALPFLQNWDLKRMNTRLLHVAKEVKPDFYLEAGGWNILPETIDALKKRGIKTALWTIDAPFHFAPISKAAPYYDAVFTGGSEAYEILEKEGRSNLHWLPFGCDEKLHAPVQLTKAEKEEYCFDLSFVGSGWKSIYPFRRTLLESLATEGYNIGVFGPGWEDIPESSPLFPCIKGGQTTPEEWRKIYAGSKIVFQSHYYDPSGKVPCYQVSPRVYEALVCGAFLLVDPQKDLLKLFTSGKELVTYNDEKDLKEKVAYYLEHPKEREKIAETGYQSALKQHTYTNRISEMLDKMKLNKEAEDAE